MCLKPGNVMLFFSLAHDLAERLLPAFDKTDTGIPFPRVNLRHGLPEVGQVDLFTVLQHI